MDAEAYRSWQPFGQIPAYRDREVEIFESGAIVLHIAKSSAILAPADVAGYARVASMGHRRAEHDSSPLRSPMLISTPSMRARAWVDGYRPIAEEHLTRRLADLQRWLTHREYLEGRFTAGDIVMSTVLRDLGDTAILSKFPTLASYRARCEARPAFARAIDAQLKDFRENAPTRSEA